MFRLRVLLSFSLSWLVSLIAVPAFAQNSSFRLGKAAPTECIFFLSSNGWAEPKPDTKNLTEKLLSEQSLKDFVQQLGDELHRVIEKQTAGNEQASTAAGASVVLLKAAIRHPLAIYLENFTATDPPVINGGAVIDCEGDIQAIEESLQKLVKLAPQNGSDGLKELQIGGGTFYHPIGQRPNEPAVRFGTYKSFLIFTLGADSTESLIKRLSGSSPQPAWLKNVEADLAVARPSMMFHVNVASIWKSVDHLLTDPRGRAGIEASGLMAVKHVSCVSGLDAVSTQTKFVIETDGPPRGVLNLLPEKPVAIDDFKSIPASAARASVLRIDLASVVEAILKIAESVDPNARQQFNAQMAQAEPRLGFSFQKDLLDGFGDLWTTYTSGSEVGAMLIPGLVVIASVRDFDALSKVQNSLITLVKAQLANAGPQAPFSIQDFTVKGQTGYRVQINNLPFPVAPSWALTKDQFVLGINPQLVTSHISGTGKKSLADNESVKNAFQWEKQPLGVTYSDPKPGLQSIYSIVNSFGPVLTGQLAQRGIDFNIPPLPPISDLEPHLAPSVATFARTPNGWRSESHSVVPSFSAATPAVAGVAVALLLPAVQQAREAAGRSQSKNNMKAFGIAMHNFHDVHKTFPAAASYDKKEEKPLLSWRVHILPYIEQQALYQKFHLDEPWDSEHNKKLIDQMPAVYARPGLEKLAQEGKTVYLVPTGEGAAFEGKKGLGIQNFVDGTSNTILAVEAHADAAVIWTKPDDLELDLKNPLKNLKGARVGGFHTLFADGSVRFISDMIDEGVLSKLFTRAGGEAVGGF